MQSGDCRGLRWTVEISYWEGVPMDVSFKGPLERRSMTRIHLIPSTL